MPECKCENCRMLASEQLDRQRRDLLRRAADAIERRIRLCRVFYADAGKCFCSMCEADRTLAAELRAEAT